MTERREFPVQDGKGPAFSVEDDVVEPEVAVHDRDPPVVQGNVAGQPAHDALQVFPPLGFAGPVLLRPAPDLAFVILAGPAVVAEANGYRSHAVQGSENSPHLGIDACARRQPKLRQHRVPVNVARHELHHVEHAANDALVRAEVQDARHGHARTGQGGEHAVLAIHGVS